MNDLAIKLTNLTKTYQLHHEKPTLVENIFRGRRRELFTAINGISLEIKKGEKIGIIGPNGSGKTTLLKLISGIATPSNGSVKTWGKVVSLIDLSAGFHPELTGQENVYLNALLVGMGRREVRSKFEEIIDFADIGNFIDAPLYTYSSGMRLRLSFSIAVSADPDILILDEGTSVGDENFQKKSSIKINDFYKKKKTILSVSHWLVDLKKYCNRIVRLDGGLIIDDGKPEKVINKYIIDSSRENNLNR